ncbi:hypothetical protein Acr_00g0037930 [Actinidia rufa]|uniref:Transposase (putative) gypsy type domain-containing protein n=1 Tax=Actinidia rufa TaxID=165716 RepID=A0A7J0DIX1_9ERIC|nr:hypothetical protein Acr_00g0037930 [Actinidia rufa]
MTDDINQSPSSPLEGSPHGNSSVHTEHPEMDTSNLIKEVNIMNQGDLDKLREKYSFPPGIQLRIPGEGEMILSTRPGEVAFYEAFFPTGLRFPILPIIRRILNHYKICPAQLSPNAWKCVVCSLMIWRYYKCHMSCDEFRCMYSLNPLPDSRWFDFKARPDKNLLRGSPSNVKGWKRRFFFASKDEWEFFSSMPPGVGIPRVPRSWDVLEKRCNKLPALTENKAKRTVEVLGKIEPGGYFEVSKVLASKTFQRSSPVVAWRYLQMEGRTLLRATRAMKTEAELKNKFEAMARLETEVAELTGKLARAKELAINEKLLYHHPNLGVDLVGMEMDTDLAEEEEAAKVGEKEEENEGEANPTP